MRNEAHRHLALEGVDGLGEVFRRLLVEVGDGFVEDQDLRAFEWRSRNRDAQPARAPGSCGMSRMSPRRLTAMLACWNACHRPTRRRSGGLIRPANFRKAEAEPKAISFAARHRTTYLRMRERCAHPNPCHWHRQLPLLWRGEPSWRAHLAVFVAAAGLPRASGCALPAGRAGRAIPCAFQAGCSGRGMVLSGLRALLRGGCLGRWRVWRRARWRGRRRRSGSGGRWRRAVRLRARGTVPARRRRRCGRPAGSRVRR